MTPQMVWSEGGAGDARATLVALKRLALSPIGRRARGCNNMMLEHLNLLLLRVLGSMTMSFCVGQGVLAHARLRTGGLGQCRMALVCCDFLV